MHHDMLCYRKARHGSGGTCLGAGRLGSGHFDRVLAEGRLIKKITI